MMTIELLRFLYGCRTRAYEQQQAIVRTHKVNQLKAINVMMTPIYNAVCIEYTF